MTGKEMTELFAVMLLAWPNAETFKGGIAKLAPTIKLWASCTADVDFWTGQQAVIRPCQQCKFPPTIAEFREQVDNVNKDIKQLTDGAYHEICNAEAMYGSLATFYAELPQGNFTRAVIDMVGGIGALTRTRKDSSGKECSMWNLREIEEAGRIVIRGRPAMVGGELPALNTKNGRVT